MTKIYTAQWMFEQCTFPEGCFTIIRLSSCLSGFYLHAAAISPLLWSSSKFMQRLLLSAEQHCSGLLCCFPAPGCFCCCKWFPAGGWMQSTIRAATQLFCRNYYHTLNCKHRVYLLPGTVASLSNLAEDNTREKVYYYFNSGPEKSVTLLMLTHGV